MLISVAICQEVVVPGLVRRLIPNRDGFTMRIQHYVYEYNTLLAWSFFRFGYRTTKYNRQRVLFC